MDGGRVVGSTGFVCTARTIHDRRRHLLTTHLVEIEQVHRGRTALARADRHRRNHRIVLVLDQVVVRLVRTLHALDVVVTVRRHGLRGIAIGDDHGAQEHHQVGLVAGLLFRTEQLADPRDIAQQRHLAVADLVVVLHQAAQHDDLAVIGEHGRLDRTLGELRDRPGWSSRWSCRSRSPSLPCRAAA